MNHSLNCGVGIVLGLEDDVVVINDVIEGGPAQRLILLKFPA
jgi:C-terminal processing protease CtpA/Prc